jgi:hypothetical protein
MFYVKKETDPFSETLWSTWGRKQNYFPKRCILPEDGNRSSFRHVVFYLRTETDQFRHVVFYLGMEIDPISETCYTWGRKQIQFPARYVLCEEENIDFSKRCDLPEDGNRSIIRNVVFYLWTETDPVSGTLCSTWRRKQSIFRNVMFYLRTEIDPISETLYSTWGRKQIQFPKRYVL